MRAGRRAPSGARENRNDTRNERPPATPNSRRHYTETAGGGEAARGANGAKGRTRWGRRVSAQRRLCGSPELQRKFWQLIAGEQRETGRRRPDNRGPLLSPHRRGGPERELTAAIPMATTSKTTMRESQSRCTSLIRNSKGSSVQFGAPRYTLYMRSITYSDGGQGIQDCSPRPRADRPHYRRCGERRPRSRRSL
jgi:hypothetical protein